LCSLMTTYWNIEGNTTLSIHPLVAGSVVAAVAGLLTKGPLPLDGLR